MTTATTTTTQLDALRAQLPDEAKDLLVEFKA